MAFSGKVTLFNTSELSPIRKKRPSSLPAHKRELQLLFHYSTQTKSIIGRLSQVTEQSYYRFIINTSQPQKHSVASPSSGRTLFGLPPSSFIPFLFPLRFFQAPGFSRLAHADAPTLASSRYKQPPDRLINRLPAQPESRVVHRQNIVCVHLPTHLPGLLGISMRVDVWVVSSYRKNCKINPRQPLS